MAYVSTTGTPPTRSLLGSIFSECVAFLDVLGAVMRTAHAVESRREPAARDLAILGIKGPLPTVR